jgi:hypothetical protein
MPLNTAELSQNFTLTNFNVRCWLFRMTQETIKIIRELDLSNKALNSLIKRQKALMRSLKQPGKPATGGMDETPKAFLARFLRTMTAKEKGVVKRRWRELGGQC